MYGEVEVQWRSVYINYRTAMSLWAVMQHLGLTCLQASLSFLDLAGSFSLDRRQLSLQLAILTIFFCQLVVKVVYLYTQKDTE